MMSTALAFVLMTASLFALVTFVDWLINDLREQH